MGKCVSCGKEEKLISEFLELCRSCILRDFQSLESHIQKVHQTSRDVFALPPSPPQEEGIPCNYCSNSCQMARGSKGFCGVRENREGRKISPAPNQGYFSWYYDPLPTNCVGDWVCSGGTGAGYPDYSYSRGSEYGYKNLAVFYLGCTFNCLFCQNWHYREALKTKKPRLSQELVEAIDRKTSCVCFFGGDPSSQILHSIHTAHLALARKDKKILRFCWETNGTMNSRFLEEILHIALETGGCVKFDLKAYNPALNIALCSRSNQQTLANFELAAKWIEKRRVPPLIVASTLLVPGYIEREEVYLIAKFIADHNEDIPYSLLGFYPHFYFKDLPLTSRRHAEECKEAALEAGLKRVKMGNIHLLGRDY
ncbi:MAG: radical SAM protein [Candidatus Aminicenantes bacterium]|nr:MAG: radical SAM protein [Candidatus Aminicenantes bacterium]